MTQPVIAKFVGKFDISQHGNDVVIKITYRTPYEASVTYDDVASRLEAGEQLFLELPASEAWKRKGGPK